MRAKQILREPKATVDELAVFGGEPAFAEALRVGRPNIGNHDTAALGEIAQRNNLRLLFDAAHAFACFAYEGRSHLTRP